MKFKVKINGFPIKVDSWELNVPCPKCKRNNKVSLAQIERKETIKCVNCGANIKLKDENGSIKRSIKDIQHGFDNLQKLFKDLEHSFR